MPRLLLVRHASICVWHKLNLCVDQSGAVILDGSAGQISANSTLVSSSSRQTTRRKKHRHPNFRDFEEGEDPLIPRTFTTNPLTAGMAADDTISGANTLFTHGPVGEPVEYSPDILRSHSDNSDLYDPRHPPQLSEVVSEALQDVTTPSTLDPTLSRDSPQPASNYSQSGIVHLGPVGSPSPARSRSSGSSVGRGSCDSRNRLDAVARDMDVVQLPSTRRDSVTSRSASESASASGSASGSGKSTSASSEGPHITFRYQHMEDDEGHHLIVGREGKLTRCEDEVS